MGSYWTNIRGEAVGPAQSTSLLTLLLLSDHDAFVQKDVFLNQSVKTLSIAGKRRREKNVKKVSDSAARPSQKLLKIGYNAPITLGRVCFLLRVQDGNATCFNG